MNSPDTTRTTQNERSATRIETSLGLSIEHRGPTWVLDLSEFPLFHGLSVLSRALVERAVRPRHLTVRNDSRVG